MKKILKKIPGLSVLVDSIKASIAIIQYSFGIKSIQEEERADPNDPKWKIKPWAKVFVRRCKYAKEFSQKKRIRSKFTYQNSLFTENLNGPYGPYEPLL